MAKAQFERDEVVNKVTGLFWSNGFNGSSMQEVFKATGLKPGSVYLAFGSKEKLFAEALSHYSQRSRENVASTLDAAPSVLEGICQIFYRLLAEAEHSDYCSCFLVKSQMELASENADLHQVAVDELEKVEQLYQEYLSRCCETALAAARAKSIMLHIFGLRVYGYNLKDKAEVLQGLVTGMPWLPWQTQNH